MPSDANSIRVSYIEEVTYGVTPSGNLKDLRLTSESLGQDHTTVRSQEIRSDRQVVDIKRVDARASGGINTELSYGAYDDLLQYALLAASWAAEVTTTGTVHSMANADNSINRSSGSYSTDGFLANRWIKISGFTNQTTTYWKIVSVAATKMVLAGGSVVTESAGPTVTITQGAHIANGTTLKSVSIEKQYTDLSSKYAAYRGMCVDQLALNVALGQIVNGSFAFLGKKEESVGATIGTGYTAAAANGVMNSVDDIHAVLENATAASEVQSISVQLSNNLRARMQIGTLGAVSIGKGEVGLTGSLRQLFTTEALMDKFLNQTPSALAFIFRDLTSKAYVVDLPRIKYTSGRRVATGANTDIIADLAFEAYREATDGVTCRIARFAT